MPQKWSHGPHPMWMWMWMSTSTSDLHKKSDYFKLELDKAFQTCFQG